MSPEMALTTALGALSVACQAGYMVKMPNRNVIHPVSLMLLTVAESGVRKTALESKFFKSIRDFQKKQENENKKRLRKHEFEHEVWSTKRQTLLSVLRKAVRRGEDCEQIEMRLRNMEDEKPELAKTINLLHEDTSIQALLNSMHDHYPVACLVSSEADEILNGLAMQSTSAINALWSGSDVTVGRSSRTSFTITEGRLTAALMTQKSSVEHYLERRGKRARGSGLLARFLTVYPRSFIGYRDSSEGKSEKTPYCDAFNLRVHDLLLKTLREDGLKLSKTQVIEFLPEVTEEWNLTEKFIEHQCRVNGIYELATDHAGKLMENMDRVAALIHLCENDSDRITKETFISARDICMHYSMHFLEYLVPETQAQKDAKKLYDKMYAYQDQYNSIFGTSWMLRYSHLTRDRLDEALAILEKNKYVERFQNNHYRFYPDKVGEKPRLNPGFYRSMRPQ
ncbi:MULTISPECIES: YfjI family protein [Halomonas]|uniref:YfjI family protein n=1 Tax=Halomonas TaxID=2745 RepID=UPI001E635C29|nr:YfjI family protein [Halomonas litopenaei]